MSTDHSAYAVTNAIVTRLTAAGVLVGRGIAPAGGGWSGTPGQSTFTPYTIVHPTIGGTTDGPISEPNADVSPDYTLTSVGATQQQCEVACDRAVQAMFGAELVIAGRMVSLLRYDLVAGVLRDDDVKPPVFFAPARFRIVTTPDPTTAYPPPP